MVESDILHLPKTSVIALMNNPNILFKHELIGGTVKIMIHPGIMKHEAPRIETERLILTWPGSAQIDQYYDDIIGTNMFDTLYWDGPEDSSELHEYWEQNRKKDPHFWQSIVFKQELVILSWLLEKETLRDKL